MKATKKEMLCSVLLCLLPVVLGLSLWADLPERVPTHFDLHNNPNGYSGKAFAVFGIPCIMAALNALTLFGLKSDPKAARQSRTLGNIMLWFVPVLSCIVMPMCYLTALGRRVNISLFVQTLIGILFIVIGNYLPKCGQNYTMGFKLPWTLADEGNWSHTHRLGGFVWVLGGAVMLLNAFIGIPWLGFAVIFAAVLIPSIASYLYYRKHR